MRRHEVAGLDQLETRAGDLLRQVRAAGMRAHGIVAAGNHHGGAADQRQHVQHIGARERAEAVAEADWVVTQIAATIGFILRRIAEGFWIGNIQRRRQRSAHALAHGEGGALVECRGAAWIDARRRIAQHQRTDLLRMLFQKAQGLRRGRSDGDEMIRRFEAEAFCERFEILDQNIVGEFLAHLLGQPGAALVVTQHAIACGEPWRHLVPRVHGAAELVQQHDGRPMLSGKRVVQAHAIGVDEGHATLLKIPGRSGDRANRGRRRGSGNRTSRRATSAYIPCRACSRNSGRRASARNWSRSGTAPAARRPIA